MRTGLEIIEKKGHFFHPSNPACEYPGILRCDPGSGNSLEIFSILYSTSPNRSIFEAMSFDILLGRIEGSPGGVTLLHLDFDGFTTGSSVAFQRLRVGTVLDGWRFPSPSEVRFNCLTFSLTGLYSWLGVSGINIRRLAGEAFFSQIDIRCTTLPKLSLLQIDGIQVDAGFKYTLPIGRNPSGIVKLTESASLTISSGELWSLEQLFDIHHRLTVLLSLFFGRPIFGYCYSARQSTDTDEDQGSNNSKRVEILAPLHSEFTNEEDTSSSFVVSYAQVAPHLGTISNRFFSSYNKFEPVIELFVHTRILRYRISLEQMILNQSQVLEAFHRRFYGKETELQALAEDRVQRVLDSCGEDDREWLAGTLQHSGKPTFRDRIEDIWKRLDFVTVDFPIKRSSFSYKIGLLRNYYTHYSAEHETKLPNWVTRARLSHMLEVLNESMILDALGLPKDAIQAEASRKIRQLPSDTLHP